MYYLAYRNIERNVDLVLVGAIYELAYSGVAFYHFFLKGARGSGEGQNQNPEVTV